jgi:cytochrome b
MLGSASRTEAGRAMRPAEVAVWDPLVRVSHWAVVALVAMASITGDDFETLHVAGGYALAGLLAVRIGWGLVGPRHARFASFVKGPRAVAGYLKEVALLRARRYLGHNPAGAAMIVALLVALVATAATGIGLEARWLGNPHWLKEAHEAAATLVLVLAGLHVAGVIAASLLHRENLVRAMFTGRKRAED